MRTWTASASADYYPSVARIRGGISRALRARLIVATPNNLATPKGGRDESFSVVTSTTSLDHLRLLHLVPLHHSRALKHGVDVFGYLTLGAVAGSDGHHATTFHDSLQLVAAVCALQDEGAGNRLCAARLVPEEVVEAGEGVEELDLRGALHGCIVSDGGASVKPCRKI